MGRAARGSQASPTASQNNDPLASFGGRGYGATGFSIASGAAILMRAAENWTDSAQGAYLTLETTPAGYTYTARAERLRVDASGNVGIGTTAPQYKLDVNGSISASGTISGTFSGNLTGNITGNAGTVTNGLYSNLSYSNPGWLTSLDAGILQSGRLDVARMPTGGNWSLSSGLGITGGYVGIGTQSPGYQLDVQNDGGAAAVVVTAYGGGGFARYLGGASRGSRATPTASQNDDPLAVFGARGYGATGFSSGGRAAIQMKAAENWTDTEQATYMTLETTPIGANATRAERLRVNASGRVSIGNTNDTEALDVTGNVNVSGFFKVGGTAGLTTAVKVRDAGGSRDCTMRFAAGILTQTDCTPAP